MPLYPVRSVLCVSCMTNDMADNSRSRSKGKPPPHIESYLTAKHSCPSLKIKSRKYYCVVYGNLLQCFNNEKSYTEKRENVKAQIDLDLVRSISETISLPASRQKQEYCFKLVFYNDNELDFIAQSKKDVKNWVQCLIQTKNFWDSWEQNEQLEIANKNEYNHGTEANKDTALEVPDEGKNLFKVSIIMSHGQPYIAYVPPEATLDDLWTAVLKSLPGHFCFTCYTCRLRGSTMDLWTVTKDGVAYRIEKHFNVAEYCSTASSPIYLLEHNFKLLVVHFEDSSFLVSPADISTKARDIPNIELFSRKLSEIECSNVQLYLETTAGSATPFSTEDAPLRTLWELHGDKWALKPREGEKFILKSRAILRNNPENIAEKIQQGKLKTKIRERKQKEVLQKIEIHGCTSKVKKILEPLVPASRALPFDVSLASSPDMNENHFSCEANEKIKKPIQHCTFNPSPETKTLGQLSAPFCPPDNLFNLINTIPSKPSDKGTDSGKVVTLTRQRSLSHGSDYKTLPNTSENETHGGQEVTMRRQRSLTDVTQYTTGSSNDIYKRGSDTGSLSRKNAIRRKSSRDSLNSFTNYTTQDKPKSENDPSSTNVTVLSRNLSFDIVKEKSNHGKTADIDSQQAQSLPEVTSPESDERTSRETSEICDQEDQICGSSSDKQDDGQLKKSDENSSDIVSDKRAEEPDIEKDSGIDSFDCSIKNDVRQSECKDGAGEKRHSCDYYEIKSAYFLKNILEHYSRLSADEEEVGVDHPPRAICLSPYHLLHVEGHWVLDNADDVEVDDDSSEVLELKNYEIFKLPGDLKVLFNRSKRTWVVKKLKADEQLEDATTSSEVFESSIEQLLTNEEAPRGNSTNENPCSMEEEEAEDFRTATWRSSHPPLTITNCGQSLKPLDDSYELDQNFTEIRILEDTIQKVFYHMEKHRDLPAAECLDDRKYPELRHLVCVELCSALDRIISNGLKKRHTLWSAIRYSVWEVVKGTSTNAVTGAIVKKISGIGALDDGTRFQLFVCECLNQKADALASWVEILQNDKKKLRMYYDEEALVTKLPKDTLEKLVSRFTFLPFSISFHEHVQKKRMKEAREVTQFAFE